MPKATVVEHIPVAYLVAGMVSAAGTDFALPSLHERWSELFGAVCPSRSRVAASLSHCE